MANITAMTMVVQPMSDIVPSLVLFFHTTEATRRLAAQHSRANPVVFAVDVTGNVFI